LNQSSAQIKLPGINRPLTPIQTKTQFSANERKYTQIKTLLVGRDKAFTFPEIGATNACNVPYAGLQLFNINILWFLICVYLRSFAEKSKSFFFFPNGHRVSVFLYQRSCEMFGLVV